MRARTLLLVVPLLFISALAADSAPRRARRPSPPAYAGPPAAERRIQVEGRIELPDGQPAAGALVVLALPDVSPAGFRFKTVETDASGMYRAITRVTLPPHAATLRLVALVPGKAIAVEEIPLPLPAGVRPPLRLGRGLAASGRLIRLDGSPAGGVEIGAGSLQPAGEGPLPAVDDQPLLPEDLLRRFYRTRTDATGRFALTTLPGAGHLMLALPEGLALAPGSRDPVLLEGGDRREIGTLVAVRPATLKVRVLDAKTGRGSPDVAVEVEPARAGVLALMRDGRGTAAGMGGPEVDADPVTGDQVHSGLMPGAYVVRVLGHRRSITLAEGEVAGPLELRTRMGPLEGRVLDASGRPVAGAVVTMTLAADALPGLAGIRGLAGLSEFAREVGRTRGDGSFVVPDFPWAAPTVTLTATRNNDQAVWSGSPNQIGERLELRLRPNVLVTVTGRLLDTHRRPLASADFSVVRWRDAPRIVWFTDAREGKANAQGRFRVDGLPRGEAFSSLSGKGLLGVLGGSGESGRSFESPRFVTRAADAAAASVPAQVLPSAAVQAVGDLVVHPIQGPEQLIQLYGFDSPEQLARGSGFLPLPSPEAAQQAREALARYHAALAAGDIDTAYRLTSRFSSDWDESRSRYLLQASIRPPVRPPLPGYCRILRFVPRLLLASLLATSRDPASFALPFNFGGLLREVEESPGWIFLIDADGRAEPRLAGILHREGSDWRVVNHVATIIPEGDLLNGLLSGRRPESEAFVEPAPVLSPAHQEAARQVGRRYLEAWSGDSLAAMRELTSPLAAGFASDLPTFRRRLAHRPDEGVWPAPAGARAALEPAADLTLWELGWLASFSREVAQLGSLGEGPSGGVEDPGFPDAYVKRGDLAVFRWRAGERDFLMVLARYRGKWQVLEPALGL